VPTFANQINHGPVPLAHLDFVQVQADKLRPAKPATEQHRQHCIVTLSSHTLTGGMIEHLGTLLCAQPITGPESELFHSSDSADSGSQLRTKQTRIGGFVSQSPNGSKLLVDGIGGQMARFQVHAITHNNDPVEGQPRLRTVPGDELIDGILIHAT
jgi:hypothetical protein